MTPFTRVEGRAYPLGRANIDTDVIVPAEHLKTVTRTGLGQAAFESIKAEPGNVFADPRFAGAPILIAGANYGCGSSREHAAWAMADMGLRAVIAPSFADIHYGNAVKNGILPVILPQEQVDRLLAVAEEHEITIDLETQTVTTPFQDRFAFAIDPFRKTCLLKGLDEIAITLADEAAIAAHESRQAAATPWVAGAATERSSRI